MKSFKKLSVLLLVLISTSVSASIFNPTLEERKDEFKKDWIELRGQQTGTNQALEDTTKMIFDSAKILTSAKEKDVDFGIMYDKHEKINGEIDDLNDDFSALVKSADKFLQKAKDEASTIRNSEMKNDSLANIKEAEVRTLKILKETKENIGKLVMVNYDVKDTITFIRINKTLKELAIVVGEKVSNLEARIKNIMADLERLNKESNAIMQQL